MGRKVLILLTDGEDQGSKVKLEAALEAAQKSDVIIYSIDISDRAFYSRHGMGYGGESVLRKLSEETGGRVIQANNAKDTSAAFQQIARRTPHAVFIGVYAHQHQTRRNLPQDRSQSSHWECQGKRPARILCAERLADSRSLQPQ